MTLLPRALPIPRVLLSKAERNARLFVSITFTRSMSAVNELPSKILLRIFAHFDLNDLVSARRVNKKFRVAADDGSLYRCVSFNRSHRLDDIICTLSRHSRHVEACTMEDIADSNTVLRYLSRCPNLRQLQLRECDGERGIKETAFRTLFAATKIRQLALKNCELEAFPALNLDHLTHLSIVDNTAYQRQLEYAEHLLPAIKRNCGTVVSLRLSVDRMTTVERNKLFDYIEECPNLKVFQFQYPHMDNISEENFRRLFNSRNLVSLSVVVSPRTTPKAYREFVNRPWLRQLRKLELSGEICRLLPQLVQKCPHIEVLRLSCRSRPFLQSTNEELLKLLAPCKKLEEVALKIVDVQNLRHTVLRLPTYLPKLRHIEIETTQLESRDSAVTPLQIEFNVVPHFALETHILDRLTLYILFRSDDLLRYMAS